VSSPSPPIIAPVLLGAVTAILNELIKFAVGDHVLAGEKVRNFQAAFPVFIIPSVGGKIGWLSEINSFAIHSDHGVLGIVNPANRIGGGRFLVVKRRRMEGRPILRCLYQVDGGFPKEN
jgi:hypothetical protein